MWRYAGSLDVRCVRTCVCNPAAVKAAEELHARSKGYLTLVYGPNRLRRQDIAPGNGDNYFYVATEWRDLTVVVCRRAVYHALDAADKRSYRVRESV